MDKRVTFCFIKESWDFYPSGSQLSNARESGNHPNLPFKRLPLEGETKSDPPNKELTAISGSNNFSNRLTLSCSDPSVFSLSQRTGQISNKNLDLKMSVANRYRLPLANRQRIQNCGTTDSAESREII